MLSVAGRTGAVTLDVDDIAGLGTAATLDAGTGANDLVQLDGDGKLPAVDGSALLNLPSGGGSPGGSSGDIQLNNGGSFAGSILKQGTNC